MFVFELVKNLLPVPSVGRPLHPLAQDGAVPLQVPLLQVLVEEPTSP
jgi:hypothetical protein